MGFEPFIAIALLGNPWNAAPAFLVGLIAKRWRHILIGAMVGMTVIGIVYPPDRAWLWPVYYLVGLVWAAAAFFVRRSATDRSAL